MTKRIGEIKKGDIVRKVSPSGIEYGAFLLVLKSTKYVLTCVRMVKDEIKHPIEVPKSAVKLMKVCNVRYSNNTEVGFNKFDSDIKFITHRPDKMWDKLFNDIYDIIKITNPHNSISVYVTYTTVLRACKKKENIFAKAKINRFAKYEPYIKLFIDRVIYKDTKDENTESRTTVHN